MNAVNERAEPVRKNLSGNALICYNRENWRR